MPDVITRERVWKSLSTAVGLLGGLLARRLLRSAYEAVRKDADAPSPFDPTNAQFSWPNVLVWAVAAGVGLGIAKVVSNRVAAIGWEVATGSRPPGTTAEPAVSGGSPSSH